MNRIVLIFCFMLITTASATTLTNKQSSPVDTKDFPSQLKYTAVFSDVSKLSKKKKHKVIVSYFNVDESKKLFTESFKKTTLKQNKMDLILGKGSSKHRWWFSKKNKFPTLQEVFANNREVAMQIQIDGVAMYPLVHILPAGHSQETDMFLLAEKQNDKKKHWKGFKKKSTSSVFQAVELTEKDYYTHQQKNIKTNPFTAIMKGPVLSQPVSSLPVISSVAQTKAQGQNETNPPRHESLYDSRGIRFGTGSSKQDDPLASLSQNSGSQPIFATPVSTGFQGMPNILGFLPPDTEGAVGPNHYVQHVNSTTQIFNKDGTTASGPFNTNTLWAGFGGRCQSDNDGDAIALYDEQADRWVLTQFAVKTKPDTTPPPDVICFAISQTNDPTGSYYLYSLQTQRFPDYYKLGVWPAANHSAYFIGTNSGSQNQYDVYAVDRDNMLAGAAVRPAQFFQSFPNLMMPADSDGFLPPDANTPGYFYTFRDGGEPYFGSPANDSLDIYEFNLNWTTPASTTFSLVQSFTNATGFQDFNWTVCGFFVTNCIPQMGSTTLIDSNSWWPQQRFQYRNYGIYGSLVGVWGVNAVSSGKRTAPRWFELRRYTTEPNWTIRQQGTYTPDANHRFSPSIAMDESQNIGLGFSETSSAMFPGIRYTVHDNDLDALGVMETEATMFNGLSAQTHSSGRWGDYASMEVDPVDDCTFWFTTEYIEANNWKTYIGHFMVPGCKKHNILLYNDYTTAHDIDVCKTAGSVDTPLAISYDFNTATTFSVTSGCPVGASCTFLSNPITYPQTTTLRIDNLASIAAGNYPLVISATDGGAKTDTENLSLNVFVAINSVPTPTLPADGSIDVSLTPTLTWSAIANANSYDIDIATDPGFVSIVQTANVATNSFSPAALNYDTFYYWRVRANNPCGSGSYSPVAAFATLASGSASINSVCSSPNPPSGLAIPDNTSAGVNDTLTIATGGTLTDVNIRIDATHTWVGDLIFTVTNMNTNTAVTVIDRPGVPNTTFGCNKSNINTTLDDAAGAGAPVENECANPAPAIGAGPFSPNNPLSAFNTEFSVGDWQINAADVLGGFTGTLNMWCVDTTYTTTSPAPAADYSDLDSSYGVAKHEGAGTFRLGTNWTADTSFSLNSDAADDDGVVASGSWSVGSASAVLSVTPNQAGFVSCWFDWNNNGTFESGEKTINQSVTAGANNISVAIPASSTFGNVGDGFLETRCRFYSSVQAKAPSSPTGLAATGEVEDYLFDGATLTPVSLAYVETKSGKSGETIHWSTTTEAGTLGFNVYGLYQGKWQLLNTAAIAALGINSVVPHDYQFNLGKYSITQFKIEELTTRGTRVSYGPYDSNQRYGKQPVVSAVDWTKIAQESQDKALFRQTSTKTAADFIKVSVNKTGIQRITYEQLLAAGVNWQGVSADEIAITFEGSAVARYVSDSVFSAGSYIDFIGHATKTLYTNTNVYELKRNTGLARPALLELSDSYIIDPNAYYMAKIVEDRDKKYSFASPANNPWFFASFPTQGTARTWSYALTTPHLVNNGISGNFQYLAWGATDFPVNNDHHLQVFLNSQKVSDQVFDGLVLNQGSVAVDYSLLSSLNTVAFKLPADTAAADLIQLDSYQLSYPSEIYTDNNQLQFAPIVNLSFNGSLFADSFEAPAVKSQKALTPASHGFIAKGFASSNIVSYAFDGTNLVAFPMATAASGASGFEVSLPAVALSGAEYFVSTDATINQPRLTKAINTNIDLSQNYDYLMIVHPDFMATISSLVTYHQANGLKVLVVDVNDIYAQYSSHRIDANAIKAFINDAVAQTGIQSVLLVGGDSYDYTNNLGIGSMSFIPTLYFPTDNIVKYTPSDALLVDTDDDLVPNLAIGRLPARTSVELQNMIDKTLSFANRTYKNTAVFATDRSDLFDNLSNQMLNKLPIGWQVDTAYISNLDVVGAQNVLQNSINSGVSLTNFFGHSGPFTWSFEHLFDTNDISSLNNIGKPTLVNQYGCWNTYYVMPNNNTMGHAFMNLNNKGAVAVLGASTLTESAHESQLGNLLVPLLSQNNMSIGQAILQAKSQLAVNSPNYLDVLLGWNLLGDPMIIMNQ